MQFIKHRVNQIVDLAEVKSQWGVEIDLRSDMSRPGSLHLSHDPWVLGDDFENWLQEFSRLGIKGPIILNTKEDGLEGRILELLSRKGIGNFFFLDTALPTLVKWSMVEKITKFAMRVSAFEPAESVTPFVGKAEWIWVDCFSGRPMTVESLSKLKSKFKVCLVSPELQGISTEKLKDVVSEFRDLYQLADAVCTKNPAVWMAL